LGYEPVARGKEHNRILVSAEEEAQSILQQLPHQATIPSAITFIEVFIKLYNPEIKLGLS